MRMSLISVLIFPLGCVILVRASFFHPLLQRHQKRSSTNLFSYKSTYKRDQAMERSAKKIMSDNVLRAAKRGILPWDKIAKLRAYYPEVTRLWDGQKQVRVRGRPTWSGAGVLGPRAWSATSGKDTETWSLTSGKDTETWSLTSGENTETWSLTSGENTESRSAGGEKGYAKKTNYVRAEESEEDKPVYLVRRDKGLLRSGLGGVDNGPSREWSGISRNKQNLLWGVGNEQPQPPWSLSSVKGKPLSAEFSAHAPWLKLADRHQPRSTWTEDKTLDTVRKYDQESYPSDVVIEEPPSQWSELSKTARVQSPMAWGDSKALPSGLWDAGLKQHLFGSAPIEYNQHVQAGGHSGNINQVYNGDGLIEACTEGMYLANPADRCRYEQCVRRGQSRLWMTVPRSCPPGLAVSSRYSAALSNPCTVYDKTCPRDLYGH